MPNYGIAPPDASTDRGQLRFLIPDTEYEAITPPAGHPEWNGDYDFFSDSALDVFLQRAGGDIDVAVVYAWGQIADFYASQAASVTTDDLRVDLSKRAQFFRDRADKAEAALGSDIFALASIGGGCWCHCHAELGPFWVSCGFCTCG